MCVCLLVCGSGEIGLAQTSPGDVLVGVTWSGGTLVSFDPSSGAILQSYLQIDSKKSFIALAYENHWRVTEEPVEILYTEYSMSKGQPLLNGVNIIFDGWLRGRMSR